jgi:hypothetical protein
LFDELIKPSSVLIAKAVKSPHWTPEEKALVAKGYIPRSGGTIIDAARQIYEQNILPGRTVKAIERQIAILKNDGKLVKRPGVGWVYNEN